MDKRPAGWIATESTLTMQCALEAFEKASVHPVCPDVVTHLEKRKLHQNVLLFFVVVEI